MKNRIKLTRYIIRSEKICSGHVFAFVSDLHEYPPEPVFERIMECGAEALLVAGDFVHTAQQYENGLRLLRMCSGEMPVYASLGNHESKAELNFESVAAETGITILDDCCADVGEIRLMGLTSGSIDGSSRSHEPDCGKLSEMCETDKYRVLMCHHPEYYEPFIRRTPVELVLSGHAHGGQWRIAGHGLFAPGQGIFPKYTSGLYDGRLLVSRGIGNKSFVPRICNPRQVIQVIIQPKE